MICEKAAGRELTFDVDLVAESLLVSPSSPRTCWRPSLRCSWKARPFAPQFESPASHLLRYGLRTHVELLAALLVFAGKPGGENSEEKGCPAMPVKYKRKAA